MVQKDVVSKFCLERSYRIIYPGFDGEISVLAPLKGEEEDIRDIRFGENVILSMV